MGAVIKKNGGEQKLKEAIEFANEVTQRALDNMNGIELAHDTLEMGPKAEGVALRMGVDRVGKTNEGYYNRPGFDKFIRAQGMQKAATIRPRQDPKQQQPQSRRQDHRGGR